MSKKDSSNPKPHFFEQPFMDAGQKPASAKATVVHIGRDSANSLVLDKDGVSDKHAEIVIYNHHYFVRDLDSAKGTFVNGTAVKMAQLKNGDLVSFGCDDASFVFSMEDDEFSPGEDHEDESLIDLSTLPGAKEIEYKKPQGEEASNGKVSGKRSKEEAPAKKLPGKEPSGKESAPHPGPATQVTPVEKIKKIDVPKSISRNFVPLGEVEEEDLPWYHIFFFSGNSRSNLFLAASFGLLLIGLFLFYEGQTRQRKVYELGYQRALAEFKKPPRNLDTEMLWRYGKPVAVQYNISDKEMTDFMKGMKDGALKTYYSRYKQVPNLERQPPPKKR